MPLTALPPRARARSTRPRRVLQLSTLLTLLLLVPLLGAAIPAVEAKRTGYFPLKPVMGNKRKAGDDPAGADGSVSSAGAKANHLGGDTLARRRPATGAAADAAAATTSSSTAPATTTTAARLQPRATARMGRRKKKDTIPKEKKDYSSFLCPGGSIACPIPGAAGGADPKALDEQLNSLADWFRIGFECSEVDSDVENCGACTSLGGG